VQSIVGGDQEMKFLHALFASVLVLVVATTTQAQVLNGSFEADPDNFSPSNWFVTGGWAYVTSVPDDMFPTSGAKYLIVDATDGSGPTIAGHGPHCWNCGGQIRQVVTRPPGEFCSLSLDWDFLPTEDAYPGFYNDFLSIDVVHGLTDTLIANVVFIDTGTTAGTPPYTNVPGAAQGQLTWVPDQSTAFFTSGMPAPVGPKRAIVDLSAVPVGTPMRIEIFVGNVGDSYIPSKAYIDRVVLSGGQQNLDGGNAALRVLGSAHADGLSGGADWSEPTLPLAPYDFRACPGQRVSFRATGEAGLDWTMAAGSLLDPGVPTPLGQINVDIFGSPFFLLFDGVALTTSTSWYDVFVPESAPIGTQLTVQAAMEQTGGGLAVSAATTVEIGAPQVPVGNTSVGGGAATDDGSTNQAFVAFGGGTWPFFGVPRSSVNVNSNGSLSFGAGDSSATETESGMLTGPARIAAIWDDLFPPDLGQVRATQTATTYTASWTNLRESPAGLHGNNFAIQLYQQNTQSLTPGGVFTIYFGSTTMDDGLTGVSPGGLSAPNPGTVSSNVDWTSLSASNGGRGVIPAGSARFEKFATNDDGSLRDTLDLMSIGGVKCITFVPDGAGGYTYFVGTR
jgi:hypothetical protein